MVAKSECLRWYLNVFSESIHKIRKKNPVNILWGLIIFFIFQVFFLHSYFTEKRKLGEVSHVCVAMETYLNKLLLGPANRTIDRSMFIKI